MTEQARIGAGRRALAHAAEAERLLATLDGREVPSAEDNTLGGEVERWRQTQAARLANTHATLAVFYQASQGGDYENLPLPPSEREEAGTAVGSDLRVYPLGAKRPTQVPDA